MVGLGTGVLCTDYSSQCFFIVQKIYNERDKSLAKTVN